MKMYLIRIFDGENSSRAIPNALMIIRKVNTVSKVYFTAFYKVTREWLDEILQLNVEDGKKKMVKWKWGGVKMRISLAEVKKIIWEKMRDS